MKRDLKCLRCGTEMKFVGQEEFQLGEESWFSGALAKMTAQSYAMEIYVCPGCGKVEFFDPNIRTKITAPVTNWTCSACGTYNNGRVQTCQGCGVTRRWSDQQAKK